MDITYKTNNMAQQTAVDWLWRWINDNQEATIKQGNQAFEQAKAMEKEQITQAHLFGLLHPIEIEATKQAEKYYNETYSKCN